MRTLTTLTALLAAPLTAQALPHLRTDAAGPLVPPATLVGYALTGLPQQGFAVLLDLAGGPVTLLGERFQLGFTPALSVIDAGTLHGAGSHTSSLAVPALPVLAGLPLYTQAMVAGPAAPNGLFEVSNGESTILHAERSAVVERFDDPALEGFTGSFDLTVRDRLQGTVSGRTVVTTLDPQGLPFGQAISSPLNHFGCRLQVVYRTRDLGARGEPELVTAIRWRAFGGQVSADRFDDLRIDVSHSPVVPDFTIDPFSALPQFPNSGLDPLYARNVRTGETPMTVASGPYALSPASLRRDGYVDYPLTRAFAYNGTDSLLIDLRVRPSAVPGSGLNGQIVRVMVPSSPQPNARVVSNGRPGAPLDPSQATTGTGDNTMADWQLELLRVRAVAVSPWRQVGGRPDYQAPSAAVATPRGTAVELEFRGADDARGSNATAWSANVDVADGKPFVQSRIALVADPASRAVPSIDTLVIPWR